MLYGKHVVVLHNYKIIMKTKVLLFLFIVVAADEVVHQTASDVQNVETQTTTGLSNYTAPQNATTSFLTVKTNSSNIIKEIVEAEPNVFIKFYNNIVKSIKDFFNSVRVRTVLRNVGTCMVNGVMEILQYYVPAPMIPLIASAAGMVIPFEPVVTLREKMPVTSYRRAFNRAVNSFMGTFDKYKDMDVEDPYMTRRFNRRFMNDSPEKKKKPVDEE